MNTLNYNENPEGLLKIKRLVEKEKTVMVASNLGKIPFAVCPMVLQQIDKQGDLWFFVSRTSGLFEDIERDNRVQILYNDQEELNYLSLFGNATHIVDTQKRKALWKPSLNNWFDGVEDSDIVLINVRIVNAFFWDANDNNYASTPKQNKSDASNNDDLGTEKGFIKL
ncbi:pyridoxamine 5'-phosphate oxidase family protein [Allomuricauda sp. F6463D]|uniref:pyridoxamine 5'-phosphate oxidase family protein n=1 Tax=Allomuricauda sp. F6463D TaxID=2926409 RepID=UPI001FF41B13|nr:pyridoxamine 5'-phosphate oxidase family protein [Muricauda sp. F6463D]MCK0159161.1 pyridoxamine 5'-phosphate oxidase family protein [Muricauda sp. F6463D]